MRALTVVAIGSAFNVVFILGLMATGLHGDALETRPSLQVFVISVLSVVIFVELGVSIVERIRHKPTDSSTTLALILAFLNALIFAALLLAPNVHTA
ncbi:MAG: hypothetical protein K8T25_11405 [Planctomycetia bacterium]|nr:hypothetical protein [Planctomycetia bacterium]